MRIILGISLLSIKEIALLVSVQLERHRSGKTHLSNHHLKLKIHIPFIR